jgi:hypothetical protein
LKGGIDALNTAALVAIRTVRLLAIPKTPILVAARLEFGGITSAAYF